MGRGEGEEGDTWSFAVTMVVTVGSTHHTLECRCDLTSPIQGVYDELVPVEGNTMRSKWKQSCWEMLKDVSATDDVWGGNHESEVPR